ncbi:MAG: hypothetical protein KatS3mg082_2187 [Nitrospiraceae bacterium]|nr:MAG: hypothetical protein KatS3mg082_2187 [Nitrospiraceae bacterium]
MNETDHQPADRFEIGGEDLLPPAHAESVARGAEVEETPTQPLRREALDDIRVRVGTLLKTETVSFLLGAGASVDCGGQLIGSVPLVIEQDLLRDGIAGETPAGIRRWLKIFYLAVRHSSTDKTAPVTRDEILERRQTLKGEDAKPLPANFEQVLAMLHRWRSALPAAGGRLRVDGFPPLDAQSDDLDACLRRATRALARACQLPASGKEDGLSTNKTLVRKLLTRPLNLKRVNVFTLNYDTLVEQASDAEGVVLLDGFVGTQRRIFRPESYEQDLYFPAETTEGRVHRFDRVLHLYKLHGSITWTASEPTIDNPYGVQSAAFDPAGSQPLLIYPTPAKYGETLGMPYSELFRRFAAAVVRPQSVLFVIGYGFGDEHVNAIIRQALAVPSFTLVIVDPAPKSPFVKTLRAQKDRRVWIAEGPTLGTLAGFVDQVLPDLRDEEIRKKVLATHRALAESSPAQGGALDGD